MPGPLGQFVTGYIEKVVNQRDLAAVDELVSPTYRGSGPGWPTTIEELRLFYRDQMRDRPDWHIDIRETVELGDVVVAQARACGTVTAERLPLWTELDWLAYYRITGGFITEIHILAVVPLPVRASLSHLDRDRKDPKLSVGAVEFPRLLPPDRASHE